MILSEDDTRHGAVETYEDSKKCAKLFRENSDKIEGILVILPNFGDEVGVVNAVHLANLNVPILVQACDDDLDKMDLSNRRDAFCGKLSVCNNLYQYGIKFTDTKLHTCPIDSDAFTQDIDSFSRVCRVVKGIRTARIGAIGARPGPFQTVRFSEKLLQASGITTCVVDLSEIISAAQKLENSQQVSDRVAEIKRYGNIADGIREEKVVKQAKLGLVIEKWLAENECDASGFQCWSSIEENYGCAVCLSMSMMGEKGNPSACEMDVMGALTMYALSLASGEPSGYLDWNNNYMDDRDKCVNIHFSNYPKSFIGKEFEISNLDILGNTIGFDQCFGACKANIVPGLQDLMKFICKNGFEHHVTMNRSNVAAVLEEALGKYLGWEVSRHN